MDGIAGGHTNMADVGHFRGMVRDSMLPREFSAEGPTSCEAEEQAARQYRHPSSIRNGA